MGTRHQVDCKPASFHSDCPLAIPTPDSTAVDMHITAAECASEDTAPVVHCEAKRLAHCHLILLVPHPIFVEPTCGGRVVTVLPLDNEESGDGIHQVEAPRDELTAHDRQVGDASYRLRLVDQRVDVTGLWLKKFKVPEIAHVCHAVYDIILLRWGSVPEVL